LRTGNKEDEGIDKFLPYNQSKNENKPYIIVTSRNRNWGGKIRVIPIDTFTKEEAIEFIGKELNISDESQMKEICQLAEVLQCRFPLALQQSVSYIKQENENKQVLGGKFKITEYLNEYEKNATKLLDFRFPDDNDNCYVRTTFITWEVTLEKIKQKDNGKKAMEILETIAYFAVDKIPTELF